MDSRIVYYFMFFVAYATAKAPPSACDKIQTRDDWGARSPIQIEYAIKPVKYVIIHHTVTPECHTEADCKTRVFNIQNYHMEEREFNDIGYNFLIGSDGHVYEGIGWHKVGAHTKNYNARSIGIGFIGNFNDVFPNSAAVRAAKKLLQCGVALGELDENYRLLAARQISSTTSPGLRMFQEIKTWEHWATNA